MSLDGDILQKYPYFFYLHAPTAFKPSLEAALLVEIVRQSREGTNLNDPYLSQDRCLLLLEEDEQFKETLLRCWRIGSFQELRESDVLMRRPARDAQRNTPIQDCCDQPHEVNAYGCNFTEIRDGGRQIIYRNTRSCVDDDTLNWIPSIGYHGNQAGLLSRRMGQTGEWFLRSEAFLKWKSWPTDRILWSPGNPGVGKTMIAAVIIDYLQTQLEANALVGYVYFDYDKRKEQSLALVLGSLLRQALVHLEDECEKEHIIQFYNHHYRHKTRPSIPELEVTLSAVYSRYQRIYLVLDALDESSELLDYKGVCSLLETLLSLGDHIKLLITSRNLGCIERAFTAYSALRLDVVPQPEDVRRYVEGRITKDLTFASHLSSLIIEKVSDTAQASFLLARLHMDTLSRQVSPGDVIDALATLSSDVDRVYGQMMARIQEQDQLRRNLAMKTLCWVAYGDSLSLQELRYALAVAPGRYSLEDYLCSEEMLTSVCAGLVIVNKGVAYSWSRSSSKASRGVTLLHYTAHEYFRRIRATAFPSADADMARTCLTYLRNPAFTIPSSFDSISNDEWVDVAPMNTLTTFAGEESDGLFTGHPFLHYALNKWGHHASLQEEHLLDDISEYFSDEGSVAFASRIDSRTLGGNPIHLASFFGLKQTIGRLLNRDACYNARTLGQSMTPLAIASSNGQEEVVRYLANVWRADPSLTDTHGRTPASFASEHGHASVVQQLLDLDRSLAFRPDSSQRTPMSYAAARGHDTVARVLLDGGVVDITTPDVFGSSPLSYAIDRGHENIVRRFLQILSFDPNEPSIAGRRCTPLSWCAIVFEYDIFELLLKSCRVDVDARDYSGRTALSYAAQWGNFDAICLLLEHDGVDVNSRCDKGHTPAWYAAQSSDWYITELLVNEGAKQTLNRNAQLLQQLRVVLTKGEPRPYTSALDSCYAALQTIQHRLTALGDGIAETGDG